MLLASTLLLNADGDHRKTFLCHKLRGHESANLVEVIREILLRSCVILAGSMYLDETKSLPGSKTIEGLRKFARERAVKEVFCSGGFQRLRLPPSLSLEASWQVALGGLAESSSR